ncbi:MAG: DUF1152 domain-containing protein [Chloroflexota bacterium]
MELNLPIMHMLEDTDSILIAGAGGGFDVYAGLPIYFTLKNMGKQVHLANYSFSDPKLAGMSSTVIDILPDKLLAVRGKMNRDINYFTEGYLTDWLAKNTDYDPTMYLFPSLGIEPLAEAYQYLQRELGFDALILVDGGVDSLTRGDEVGPGTLLEDTITLLAVEQLDIPTKVLACIGFGTEVEERLDHYAALENMAGIIKAGGFYGTCSPTPQMTAFQQYEAACRHAWDGEKRHKSHISTRIIPAAHGEFGDFRMYESERVKRFISPLMSIYWFFDADVVASRNLSRDVLKNTQTKDEARDKLIDFMLHYPNRRDRKVIPY